MLGLHIILQPGVPPCLCATWRSTGLFLKTFWRRCLRFWWYSKYLM